MKPAGQESRKPLSAEPAPPRLEDLVPIAMVVAAGCESCAEKMVRRALERGSSEHSIERTLRIVAGLRSADCFADAVGPEVIARMAGPLRAGERALPGPSAEKQGCCRAAAGPQQKCDD